MDALTVNALAADRLLVEKESLARAITDALYQERPELTERYGNIGRMRCLEDMRHNIEHLMPAVDLAQPAMFAGYVRWLDNLLQARNVAPGDVVRTLELTEREVRSRFTEAEAEAIATCIRAGLEELVRNPGR